MNIFQVHHQANLTVEIEVDLTFINPTDKKLTECTLALPLKHDAVISGYEVEMNGVMVPAVIVEKEDARVIYETERRAGRQVAAVEQSVGCFDVLLIVGRECKYA